jgi:hypothetical protein
MLYKQLRMAWQWAVVICLCGVTSLALSMSAKEAVYGLLANLFNAVPPVAIYYSVKHLEMSMLLLKLQNVCGYVCITIVVIVNSVMLSREVSAFRFCFGDLSAYCYDDPDDSSSLLCRDEYDNAVKTSDQLTSVDCRAEDEAGVFIGALIINFAACVLYAPYMLLCCAIRDYVMRMAVDEGWTNYYDSQLLMPKVLLRQGQRVVAEYEDDCPMAVVFNPDDLDKESFEEGHPLVKR